MKPLNNLEKRKATLEARNAAFASQTVTVDQNWKIVRADEKNWEVQYKGQFWGYFGSLVSAFKALPAKMLTQEAKGGIDELLAVHNDIIRRIDNALV